MVAKLQSIEEELTTQEAMTLLNSYHWNYNDALAHLNTRILTHQGLLLPPDPSIHLQGMVNSHGTSCYLDALMFALFATQTLFDPLLNHSTSLGTACRMYVNHLRQGYMVTAPIIESVRDALHAGGWPDNTSQEDAAELFLWFMDQFEMPFLPMNLRLLHGAESVNEDEKLVSERLLQLSIPESRNLWMLEELLSEHFFGSRVEGLRRSVKDDASGKEHDVTLNAWSTLSICPFWTMESESGQYTSRQYGEFSDKRLALPIALKRYRLERRYNGNVHIPLEMDFSTFVLQGSSKLRLRSVVCHLGSSLQSGHYIAYTETCDNVWLRMDNLQEPSVETCALENVMAEIARNGYLLLYELV
jgi:hypothetical protein